MIKSALRSRCRQGPVIRSLPCVLVSKNSLASLHSISYVSRVNAALVALTATSPDCSGASDIQIPEDHFFFFFSLWFALLGDYNISKGQRSFNSALGLRWLQEGTVIWFPFDKRGQTIHGFKKVIWALCTMVMIMEHFQENSVTSLSVIYGNAYTSKVKHDAAFASNPSGRASTCFQPIFQQ